MTREEFIFTKAFPQRLYRHILFWVLYFIFCSIAYFHDGIELIGFRRWLLVQTGEQAFHIITELIYAYVVIYFLLPVFWYRKRYVAFLMALALFSVIHFWVYYLEHIYFFKGLHEMVGLKFRPPEIVFWFTLISFVTLLPICVCLVIAIKTLKNFYIKSKENQQLTRENANAELQLLKAQIHPHFLFNTLNNIYSFALSKSSEASGLVSKLSDTIHYMITDCNAPFVPLEKEIKMLEDYIDLERVRYGPRLEMGLDINRDHQSKLIAPLLMIPFVENCFKHGTSMATGKQWINLSIDVQDNVMDFKIANSKPRQGLPVNGKHGIGLQNVKQRLALLYPGRHKLNISSTDTMYSVQMQIQLA